MNIKSSKPGKDMENSTHNTERKGRAPKRNADYFSHDADASSDEKLIYLESRFGLAGYALYFKMIEALTRATDFVIHWSEIQLGVYAKKFGVSIGEMESFIDAATMPGIECFILEDGKLYSNGLIKRMQPLIEKREKEALRQQEKRSKDWVVNDVAATKNNVAATIAQSKVKESKVKKSKVCMAPAEPDAHTPEQKEKYKFFSDWIEHNAPRVNKMKEPITQNEFNKITSKMNPKIVTELLLQMHNWEPLLKKNRSAYLTLTNWYSRRDEVKRPLQQNELDNYQAKREKELQRAAEILSGNL
jgi:hypothetical protein